jgi:hypothetical protein
MRNKNLPDIFKRNDSFLSVDSLHFKWSDRLRWRFEEYLSEYT